MNQTEQDIETLLTVDGKGRQAKLDALKRLTENNHAEILAEILEVLEKRAIGHVFIYSDRLTPFIPKIKKALG